MATTKRETMKNDIFIGYRREQEFDLTNLLSNRLKGDGYSVFFDLDVANNYSIGTGHIESQIRSRIDECTDFIVIVDERTFEKKKLAENERDWLQFELEYANSQGKHIIPIFKGIKNIRKKDLPEKITFLSEMFGIKYDVDFFNTFYENLKNSLHSIALGNRRKDNYSSYESYGFDKHDFTLVNCIRETLWYIAGADTDILRLCPSCYDVYTVIGTIVCLTALLALLSGVYAIYSISGNWYFPLCFAPVYAFMIFSINRIGVVDGGNIRSMSVISSYFRVLFRFALAIIIGIIISAPIEILIFHNKIDEDVAINYEKNNKKIQLNEQIILDKQKELKDEVNNIDSLQKIFDEAVISAKKELADESEGVGKSKRAGKGLIYEELKKEVEIAEQKALAYQVKTSERRKQIYDELANIDSLRIYNYIQFKQIENNNDFITRYKSFNSLIDEDEDMRRLVWAVRLLFIMLEIAPIVSKLLLSGDNKYEEMLKSIPKRDRL